MSILRVKNWVQFQHYKDRSPAWIKLHRYILDDYDFQMLPVASRALAPMLWLLASEYEDGKIDAEPRKLAFRLRMTEKEISEALKPLISAGFFFLEQGASDPLADCLPREEERREEREEEKEKRTRAKPAPRPDGVSEQTWKDWLALRKAKKAPVTDTVVSQAVSEATKAGMDLEGFLKVWCARGSQGLQADWLKPKELATGNRRMPATENFDSTYYGESRDI